ncbi:Dor1-like family-domain-containing protein [Suillus plorans]|uniref:Conserved oligomeric Golgi complex subunit 8 n=1 Tax=Suillus plorans TaxID=116603 RepID=A0A9P7DHS8_9AGAM|nr:Dor1-like family-domain-containing protein [Suillus plorans]KAG1793410.1 Dor1-like family-domain-containing protein [Suillus plorans]
MTTAVSTSSELSSLPDVLSGSLLASSSSNLHFLAELPTNALSDLLSTPTALTTQSHTLTSSLTALTHTSYPTFLSLHDTSTALLTSLSSFDTSLNSLINTALPALDGAARVFREKTGPEVIEGRQKARVVLEQHDKLCDLLDVPVLIDTCVRNGLYAEALSLAAHASSALSSLIAQSRKNSSGDEEATHGLPLQLADSLQAEIASSLHSMQLILLNTLYEPARKLPAFWKAVQFLRRMKAIHEDELALVFISARIGCLRDTLDGIERDAGIPSDAGSLEFKFPAGSTVEEREREIDREADDVARFLKKYIDIWREGAYDLVTQYTTIFLDRSHAGARITPPADQDASTSSYIIRQTLPSTLLELLLPTLRSYLERAYPHLAPLATQLAYCSSALARVGMDFRALLSPLISRSVISGFVRDVRLGAEHEWSGVLAKHVTNKPKASPPSIWLVATPNSVPAFKTLALSPSNTSHSPPQVLTAFPPLAKMLNAYIRALNRLRMLAPVDALWGIVDGAEECLANTGHGLLQYAKDWRGGDAKEIQILQAAGAAYTRVLVPWLQRAIVEGVFSASLKDRQSVGDGAGDPVAGGKGKRELSFIVREWESWLGSTGI